LSLFQEIDLIYIIKYTQIYMNLLKQSPHLDS